MARSIWLVSDKLEQLNDIEQRFLGHIVSYSNPGTANTCWMNFRLKGDCGCNAEADMQGLIDEVKRLQNALVETDWEATARSLMERNDELQAQISQIKANHVTVAEEVQRRHDACAPLGFKIELLRAALTQFVRCADGRVWPSDKRVMEAKELLARDKSQND